MPSPVGCHIQFISILACNVIWDFQHYPNRFFVNWLFKSHHINGKIFLAQSLYHWNAPVPYLFIYALNLLSVCIAELNITCFNSPYQYTLQRNLYCIYLWRKYAYIFLNVAKICFEMLCFEYLEYRRRPDWWHSFDKEVCQRDLALQKRLF